MRNIEDAAVREEPAEDDHESAPAIEAEAPQAAIEADGPTTADQRAPEPPLPHNGAEAPAGQDGSRSSSSRGTQASRRPAHRVSALADRGAGNAPAPAPEPFTPAPVSNGDAAGRTTGFRSAHAGTSRWEQHNRTATRPAPGAGPSATATSDDDHDGQTVMKSSLPRARSAPVPAAGPAADRRGQRPAGPGTGLRPRPCQSAHQRPAAPSAAASLLPDAVQVARPRLGRMRVSTGELVDLDQSLVIGRQPSVSRVQGGVHAPAGPGGQPRRRHLPLPRGGPAGGLARHAVRPEGNQRHSPGPGGPAARAAWPRTRWPSCWTVTSPSWATTSHCVLRRFLEFQTARSAAAPHPGLHVHQPARFRRVLGRLPVRAGPARAAKWPSRCCSRT